MTPSLSYGIVFNTLCITQSRPSPLCFFENCLDAFQIPSYAAPCSQKMGTRADDPTDSKVMEPFASDFPSYCPSAWVWWVERAQGLVSVSVFLDTDFRGTVT